VRVTDSLTRLVLRAQGQLAIAEPLLPTRHEPAGIIGVPDWQAPATFESEAPASPATGWRAPRIRAPAPQPEYRPRAGSAAALVDPLVEEVPGQGEPAQQRIEPGRPASRTAVAADQTPGSPEVAAQGISSPNGSPEVVAVSAEVLPRYSAAALPAAPISDRFADHSAVAPSLSEPAGVASDMTPSAPRSAPGIAPERLWLPDAPARLPAIGRAAVPADFPVRQMQAAAPDVQISIGVVEVHAAPRRPAPVRAAPARPRQVSLADYLAQRRGRSP
jgi:hypothetical protein